MNNLTSRIQRTVHSGTWWSENRKKLVLMLGVGMMSLLVSPAWAGDFSSSKRTAVPVQLTSLSIQIGPGGFHFGIGGPFYGPVYGRPHLHIAPRHFWAPPRYSYGGHKHYSAPKRFRHGDGWKKNSHRGKFRGKGTRGRGGHRGGRW